METVAVKAEGKKERFGVYRVKEVPVNVEEGKVLHSVFFPQVRSISWELQGRWRRKKYVRVEKWNFLYKIREEEKTRYTSDYTYVAEGAKESDYEKRFDCMMGHTLDEANKLIDEFDAYQENKSKSKEEDKIKKLEVESRNADPLKIHEV